MQCRERFVFEEARAPFRLPPFRSDVEKMAQQTNQTKKATKTPKKRNPKTPNPDSGPKLLGYFSVDGDRTFCPDISQLLYFNPPEDENVHLDLDEGIESAVRRKETFEEEGIDLLLEWLKRNHKKLQTNPTSRRRLQPKFICTRGALTRILTSRCAQNESWIMYAAMLKGSIYLCADKTRRVYFATTSENDKFSSWGYKFEQCVLSASPDTPPDTSKPVIEPAEFRCVYQRRIGNHPVLFSAVMKGVCSDKPLKHPLPLNKLKFIETKTHKIIEHAGHERSLRSRKFLRWWAQCYLTDTQEVLCGFRDECGIVQKLRRYNIDELVKLSQDYWSPTTCIDFCKSFLTTIADTVVSEYTETMYRFEYTPNQGINIMKLSSEDQYGFIPESFVEALG